jgi:hypothetical protein
MGTWEHNSFSVKNIFPWEHGNITLLVKKNIFHGNMGTYKIGELPLA